tara:strand:+ start:260 stop:1372 length:1113 start_codon:yes stop_codon:yes gene_type:complete
MLNFKRLSFNQSELTVPIDNISITIINAEDLIENTDSKIKKILNEQNQNSAYVIKTLLTIMSCSAATHGIINNANITTSDEHALFLLLATVPASLYRLGSHHSKKLRDPYILGSQYNRFCTYVSQAAMVKTMISFISNEQSFEIALGITLTILPFLNKQLFATNYIEQKQWNLFQTSAFKPLSLMAQQSPNKFYALNVVLNTLITYAINFTPISTNSTEQTEKTKNAETTQFLMVYAGTPLLILSSLGCAKLIEKTVYTPTQVEEDPQQTFKLKDLLPISTDPKNDLKEHETPEIITLSLFLLCTTVYSIIDNNDDIAYIWLVFLGTLSAGNFLIKPIMSLIKKCNIPLPNHYVSDYINRTETVQNITEI